MNAIKLTRMLHVIEYYYIGMWHATFTLQLHIASKLKACGDTLFMVVYIQRGSEVCADSTVPHTVLHQSTYITGIVPMAGLEFISYSSIWSPYSEPTCK